MSTHGLPRQEPIEWPAVLVALAVALGKFAGWLVIVMAPCAIVAAFFLLLN